MCCADNNKHGPQAFRGAHHIACAFATVLRYDVSVMTDDLLKSLDIYTQTASESPSWLPSAGRHPRLRPDDTQQTLAPLQPPRDADEYTGYEWAGHFCDVAHVLSHLTPPLSPETSGFAESLACPRPPEWENRWERFMATGEQKQPDEWHLHWRMLAMLEADGYVGCIAADNDHLPLPDAVPYRRSELLCLLALVCRELVQDPANKRVAPTVVMFTGSTARVLQAWVDLPLDSDSAQPPKIHIVRRLEVPLRQIASGGGSAEAYEQWLEAVSWLSFRPLDAPALQVSKQRCKDTTGRRTPSDTSSERLFSGSSEGSTEGRGEAASPSSRPSCSPGSTPDRSRVV